MFNRIITAGLFAAAAAFTPLRADVSQYLVDLRNSDCWSGTHIIYANDSGMTGKYSLRAYDSDGLTRLTRGADYAATINTSTHNLSFTPDSASFPDGFCGVLVLRGPFGGSDTSDPGDFEAGSTGPGISVAHQSGYSQRTYNSATYASDVDAYAGMLYTPSCQGYVKVFFAASGQLTFMHTAGPSCISTTSGAAVGGYSYPSGATQIATFYVNYYGGYIPYVVLVSDDRPWA